MLLAAASNAKTLWFVTRGSGVVALLLLTASVLLGVVVALRWRGREWPRFAVTNAHRNLTLLSIVFVAIHVITTVADGYAPISLTAAVVPFVSPYRPLWLSLGAISFDLLLALVVTSLARRWVSARIWRAVHWAAYAAWPVALLHSFGTGSDARLGWLAALGLGCLAAVALAVLARAALGSGRPEARALAAAAALAAPVAIFLWYSGGPLRQGWARRAGTPTTLLARTARATSSASLVRAAAAPPTSFVSALSGRISRTDAAGGLVTIHISVRLRGGPHGAARIDLRGVPGDGGVGLTASGVSFVPETTRQVYTGKVVGLEGSQVAADVRDAAGDRLQLQFSLRLDAGGGTVAGLVTGAAVGSGG